MLRSFEAELEALLEEGLGGVYTAVQLELRRGRAGRFSRALGLRDPEAGRGEVGFGTRFDLASITKVFTSLAFMSLVEAGRVGLDDPVSSLLPDFSGSRPFLPYEDPQGGPGRVDLGAEGEGEAGEISFRDLLSHRSGLPAWRPLYREADAEAARRLALGSFLSYPRGSRVVYSDLGFVLLGLAMETLEGKGLGEILSERICRPLGLESTGYRPTGPLPGPSSGPSPVPSPSLPEAGFAATELCPWRGRRLYGEVHDENAARLGGRAGQAGLFSTARDLARLGEALLGGGPPLLSRASLAEMLRLQAEEGELRRGLGFALRSPDPRAASFPLGEGAYGHLGFTGGSFWIDPGRGLIAACLANRVYLGRDPGPIGEFRLRLHRLAAAWADGAD